MLGVWQFVPFFYQDSSQVNFQSQTWRYSLFQVLNLSKEPSTDNSISLNERNANLIYFFDFSSRFTDQAEKTMKSIGHNQGELLRSDLVVWFFLIYILSKTILTFICIMASSAGYSQRYWHHCTMRSAKEHKILVHSSHSFLHDFKKGRTNFSEELLIFYLTFIWRYLFYVNYI